MNLPRDQRPATFERIKLRWWAVTFVPIALALYLSAMGWLHPGIVMLVVFCMVFWLISFGVALVMLILARRRQAKERKQ